MSSAWKSGVITCEHWNKTEVLPVQANRAVLSYKKVPPFNVPVCERCFMSVCEQYLTREIDLPSAVTTKYLALTEKYTYVVGPSKVVDFDQDPKVEWYA